MSVIDDLHYYAARKAKADGLSADVRAKYAEAYDEICGKMRELMITALIEAVTQAAQSDNAELSKSMDAMAHAYDSLDVDAFLAAAERCVDAGRDKASQMGFEDIVEKTPWEE